MEQLLDRADLFEFPVGFFQDSFIRIVKPVTFAVAYRLHGLCIELTVVDCYVCVDGGRHFHTDKTTAAAAVRQQVFVVARSDERGIPAYFLNAAPVGLAQVGDRFLQRCFRNPC